MSTLGASNGRMPVLFVGHGSPMNVILDNAWSRGFAALAGQVPRPAAILAVSAHWYGEGTHVTIHEAPPTLHDFGGFPPELYEIEYPAPGAPALARRVVELLGADRAALSDQWGLDHGTWSVLRWMLPDAAVPVVQLSLDARLPPAAHAALGRALAPLRDEGVLMLASGNVTHNLRDAFRARQGGDMAVPDYAQRFDDAVAQAALSHDTERMVALWPHGADALRAHPSPDHFLPLLYAFGASDAGDAVAFPIEGFDLGALSMRAIRFG